MKIRMTCKEATEKMDLGVGRLSFLGWLRLELHLVICLACRRYLALTEALKRLIRETVFKKEKLVEIGRLNQDLLKKFT